jgi:hypothetical protein
MSALGIYRSARCAASRISPIPRLQQADIQVIVVHQPCGSRDGDLRTHPNPVKGHQGCGGLKAGTLLRPPCVRGGAQGHFPLGLEITQFVTYVTFFIFCYILTCRRRIPATGKASASMGPALRHILGRGPMHVGAF